jgi:hypothetical protein
MNLIFGDCRRVGERLTQRLERLFAAEIGRLRPKNPSF